MKRIAFLLISLACASVIACAGYFTPFVNPFIGTGAIDGGLSGNTYPGATVPFGMVQLSPDTHEAPDWYNASGYNYRDSVIYGFSHTRLSGTGASDLIDIMLLPTTDNARCSRFSHSMEEAHPGYYSVDLLDEDIKAELTATTHVGIHRYIYPVNKEGRLVIDADHSSNKGSWGRQIINAQLRKVAPNAIAGYRIITGWAKLRKVCFYIEFSKPIHSLQFSDGDRVEAGAEVINGRALKAKVSFGTTKDVVCKVAFSPVSIENARENLEAEARGWNFDEYVVAADEEWNRALGAIEVNGDKERATTFYTALYHTMIQPNHFSDVNGQYMSADYSVQTKPKGEHEYTTFSLWDTYRAAHPLYTILMPEKARDFVNSMLDHCEAYGYLPIWQLWGQDNYCMIGNHAIPVVVDAVLKGIPGIDAERAWKAVYATSINSHPNSPWNVWEKYGYMPENIQSQSVSITLEVAFDDWCVAQLAKHLGKMSDYKHFINRSEYYRNLFNDDTKFFQPKDDNGNWILPFDPLKFGANGGNPFTEGNAWQYLWYVPHNVDALISLMGGAKEFENRLDAFFTLTESSGVKNDNISGLIGQYAHGNEPSHHVAYLYNYVGKPEKTRNMVSRISRELYNNTSSGYAGNDDCGEMSSWYIFSALGFYPVNPTGGEYQLGIPLFDSAKINLANGKTFNVLVKNKKIHKSVKAILLNGKRLNRSYIKHSEIMAGGVLEFCY